MKKAYLALATTAALTLTGPALADADKCQNLSGTYGNGSAAIVVGSDGKSVNIVMMQGTRPNAYGMCSGGNLNVNFPVGGAIDNIQGTWDGTTISWTNGTSWTKDPVPN